MVCADGGQGWICTRLGGWRGLLARFAGVDDWCGRFLGSEPFDFDRWCDSWVSCLGCEFRGGTVRVSDRRCARGLAPPREPNRLALGRDRAGVGGRGLRFRLCGVRPVHRAREPAGRERGGLAQSWLFAIPLFGLVTFLLLLFPSGRLLSRRWRPAAWLACGAILLAVISEMIRPGPLQEFDTVENPFGIEDARSILEASSTVSFFLVFLAIIVAAVSLLRRFRRSRDVEREQIKWVVAACGLLAAAFLSGPVLFWWIPPVGDAWKLWS